MLPATFSDLGALAVGSLSLPMLLAKATIVLVVALGITMAMQRASAGARHLVWLVTLGTLLLVPALSAWAPLHLAILPAAPIAGTTRDAGVAPSSTVRDRTQQVDVGGSVGMPASPIMEASAPVPVSATSRLLARIQGMSGISMLLALWAAVVLAIGASLAWAGLTVRRIVSRARPLDTPSWLTPLWEVSDRFGLEEPPRLLQSDEAKMPFACGMLTPTIVLPKECESWSLDRRHAVLLHELAHVRRHDLFGHTLGRLVCAVYWFHPLVWAAAKQLRSESERACDDLPLACGTRATDYAEHLLDLVTSVKRDATPSMALAMARRKEFEGRMLAILDPDLRHSSPSRQQSAALIGSLVLIAVLVGAAAPTPRAAEQTATIAAASVGHLDLAAAQQTPMAKGYPDSREIIGGTKTHTNNPTYTSQTTSQATRTITSQSQQTATNALEDVVKVGMSVGVKAGMSASSALIEALGKQSAGKAPDERAVLLARILASDTSASLRRVAAWGLNEYADHQVAAEALANALRHDRDVSVREMAAWSLSDADHSSVAIEALSAALHDADTQVRATAAWALGNVGDRSSAEPLAAALSDPSTEVRKRAAWALGNTDLKEAPRQLLAQLSDKDPEMREITAWALYEIEDPAAIPALQTALAREQSKELQIAYIRALAAVGEKSVDALKGLLESKDPQIRNIAVRALAGGNAAGPWPRPWPQPRPYPN